MYPNDPTFSLVQDCALYRYPPTPNVKSNINLSDRKTTRIEFEQHVLVVVF